VRFVVAAFLVGWVASVTFAAAAAGNGPPRPNIVVIMADDMGYSDAGCFGGEIETPNLDKLAADGLRFTDFYNTSRCCPTRSSLLTGVYPHQAGVGHMTWRQMGLPGYRADLSKRTPTLAEILKPAGYSSYMVGKWHVTINDLPNKPRENWPRQRGFDRFYGMITGSGSYYDPRMLVRDDMPISPAGDSEYKPEHYYFTDAIADQSVRYIAEHHALAEDKDKPFFLYTAFTSPHWPLHAPAKTIAKYKGKYDSGYEPVRAARFERMKQLGLIDATWELSPPPQPWAAQKNKEWEARCMEVYAAQIDRMDQGIGKIIDALKAAGALDNTLILFLQDNGGCAESNGRDAKLPKGDLNPPNHKPTDTQWNSRPRVTRDGRTVRGGPKVMPGPDDTFIAYGQNWANVSNTPFREYKHLVHEGGISTPLIAHWPAGIARKGELDRTPGHLIDIVATAVELSGATFPPKFDGEETVPLQGVSLTAAFKAGGVLPPRGKPIFFEHEGNRAVRDGPWKLVAKHDGAWELYDMAADRSEMHDLAAEQPERVKAMSDAWQKWAEASQVLPLRPWDDQPGKSGGE
jgi:arylsulfatase